ncbi:MAG TPA: electron transfer flavoprotein subunit alpha/FixB family protein [Syntrophorhabdaceae bacterium]|nr:electron transfer flavoprotein subunit alpha/FixB family protein [Syntrophorhabdaceae bacterium]HQH43125.1 electron transfer flavoprotein subunit alpha/FixB family protein [Syntrophorhabdaceae bacterium]HRV21920.1 electron transfer flavoprotein subunit alpha/FixB family protein [Syntrophorhabdaceae bacterium]
MSKDIFVFIECKEGSIRKTSFELLSKGKELAEKLSSELYAVLLGFDTKSLIDEIKPFAHKILSVDTELLKDYRWDTYTDAMEYLIKKYSPYLVLGASTITGKDLFPRLAARLDAPIVSDAIGIEVIDGEIKIKKPIYGGKIISWVTTQNTPISIVTFRPNSFSIVKGDTAAEVIDERLEISMDSRINTNRIDKGGSKKVDLQEADFIICGGRGMKGPENFNILEEIAEILGGRVGASRAVVDSKWRDYEDQVGKSGKTVSPKLYIGCGVSGALHHTMGMDTSKVIVAVNKDPNALIFQYADYGIVDDLFNILPALKDGLKNLKQEA